MLEHGSKGYIKFTNGSIVLTEKIFIKEGRKVRVIPMIHIGKKEFYQQINKDVDNTTTLYLLEGIQDKDKLLEGLNHRKTASAIGQESQADHFRPGTQAQSKYQTSMIQAISADIDASEMSHETIELLNFLTDSKKDGGPMSLIELNMKLADKKYNKMYYDIIELRNNKLMSLFNENKQKYETIIIPWGALHLPDIERRLVDLGYEESSERKERVAISVY